MEIEGESLARLHDLVMYPTSGQDGDGQRIVDFLTSVEQGNWLHRWHVQRDLAAPVLGSKQYLVSLRDGLVLRVICDYNARPDVIAVYVVTLA